MITHHIIDTKHYAYIEIMGSPKVDEYIKAATIFAQDPNYAAELDRICDFSQANLSTITLHDINEFANFVIENIPLGQHTKVALVAPEDESRRGIFESFMTRMGTGRFKLFTDPDDAVTWVHDH